jgi:hypothetical protein
MKTRRGIMKTRRKIKMKARRVMKMAMRMRVRLRKTTKSEMKTRRILIHFTPCSYRLMAEVVRLKSLQRWELLRIQTRMRLIWVRSSRLLHLLNSPLELQYAKKILLDHLSSMQFLLWTAMALSGSGMNTKPQQIQAVHSISPLLVKRVPEDRTMLPYRRRSHLQRREAM